MKILDLELDRRSGTVWRDGEVLDLPDLSYRLLEALVAEAPALVGKDELIRRVWGDVVVSDETLAQRVRLLRHALGDESSNPRYFQAVRGRGYRLIAPVETRETPPERRAAIRNPRLLAAALAMAAVLGLFVFDTAEQEPAVLAVLPFDDMSREGGYGFFADGMQEELLSRLGNLESIEVLSRTSVERYRGTTEALPDIADALEASVLIEGSVRVDGDQLRVTVQLIDGASDSHLWAETYDAGLTVENIFDIQRSVANSVAAELEVELGGGSAQRLPTDNLDAYNQYLLGRHHTFRQTPENLALAVSYLEEATRLDPEFAEAWASLGWALSFQGTGYGDRRPDDVYPRAREAALQAIRLDDDLAEGRSLYADILTWYDWDFALAESEHRRTMALDRYNVLGYALFLSTQERHDEAIELIERRISFAPRDEYVWVNAAWRYLHAGLLERAIAAAENAPNHPDAPSAKGSAYLALGEIERAIQVFEADLNLRGPRVPQLANLAHAYFRADRSDEARRLLLEIQSIAEERYVPPTVLASLHFANGCQDLGFAMLERAVEQRDRGVIFLGVSDEFRKQRDNPRFEALLERVGLPDAS